MRILGPVVGPQTAIVAKSWTLVDLTAEVAFEFTQFWMDFYPSMSFSFEVPGPPSDGDGDRDGPPGTFRGGNRSSRSSISKSCRLRNHRKAILIRSSKVYYFEMFNINTVIASQFSC